MVLGKVDNHKKRNELDLILHHSQKLTQNGLKI